MQAWLNKPKKPNIHLHPVLNAYKINIKMSGHTCYRKPFISYVTFNKFNFQKAKKQVNFKSKQKIT
jgi:hypothetical protein